MTVKEWTRLRRADRAMDDPAEIEALLGRAPFGYTATSRDGQPFLHPSLFWYDAGARRIYFHGALEGRTRDNILSNPHVCFSVAEMGRLLPADTAMEFGNEYASVIVFGRAHVVDDPAEKRGALQGLLDKYFPDLHPEQDYRPITDKEMAITSVYAIAVDGWSGKRATAS